MVWAGRPNQHAGRVRSPFSFRNSGEIHTALVGDSSGDRPLCGEFRTALADGDSGSTAGARAGSFRGQ